MLTSYITTLLADGKDHTMLRIAITDSLSREITSATDSIRLYLTGEARITNPDGSGIALRADTAGRYYAGSRLVNGICNMILIAGVKPGKIKIEAKCSKLWPGGA
jgi:hypothetical protein